jgi:hypothetical protein
LVVGVLLQAMVFRVIMELLPFFHLLLPQVVVEVVLILHQQHQEDLVVLEEEHLLGVDQLLGLEILHQYLHHKEILVELLLVLLAQIMVQEVVVVLAVLELMEQLLLVDLVDLAQHHLFQEHQ